MAIALRKSSDRGTVGLDIDGRFLAAVQLEGGRITKAASAELPEGAVRDGEVADPEALAAALKSFFSSAGLSRNVRLGVANQQIVVRLIELPQIEDSADQEAAVRFQAADAIAMPLDEAVLDYQVTGYGDSPEGGKRMRVVLVAARRSMIDGFVGAVRKAGLKPQGIDLDAFALVRILAGAGRADDNARVFCHLGGVTNLAIALGDSCHFTRPLSTPWNGERAAADLADEVRLSIDYYMAQPNARPVSEAVLSGPGARDATLVEELGGHLGLPTTVAQPLGAFDATALEPGDDVSRYTVAAGLSMGEAA